MATSITPLQLQSTSDVLWTNTTPSSIRYCRPVQLEYVKESAEFNVKIKEDFQQQINELKSGTFHLSTGQTVTIKYDFHLTQNDGKVVSNITKTSSYQVCLGNVARKAFANSGLLAEVLNIGKTLIDKLHINPITISYLQEINTDNLKKFCTDTYKLYVSLYPWYYMPSTLHRILIHGA